MTHTPGAYYHKGIKEIVITSADERYVFSGEDGGFVVGILTPDDIDLLVGIYEDRDKIIEDLRRARDEWEQKTFEARRSTIEVALHMAKEHREKNK